MEKRKSYELGRVLCLQNLYNISQFTEKKKTMISENMNETLKDVILNMTLPRFVWCIDLAGTANFKEGLTSGRIIVDTTAPTLEEDAWLLRHDGEKNRIYRYRKG